MKHGTNTTRVGIIGLGMGKNQISAFQQNESAEVVALCDTDETRLAQTAREYNIERTYTDMDALIEAGELDAVVIATPNHTHHPFTLKAFNAGLHVLCEKPLALNAQQAREMVDAAEQAGCRLGIHYNHRMSPTAQLVHRYIEDGSIGSVYYIRSVWHRNRGIPVRSSGWFYKSETAGGGCFVDLGVHMIDMALTFAGFPQIRSVSGQLHNRFSDVDLPAQDMDVEDFGTAYIRCADGLTISVEISWASHAHKVGMCTEVYGTDGGAVRDGDGVTIMRREHGQVTETSFPRGLNREGMPSVQEDFINAIKENHQPYCSGSDGLLLMKVLDAVSESSRTGHEVSLEDEQ